MGHDSYVYGPPFPDPVLNSQEPAVHESWMSDEDLIESRRTTITQQIQCVIVIICEGDANSERNHWPVFSAHRDELNRGASSSPLPLNNPPGTSNYQYRSKELPNDSLFGHYTRQNHRTDDHRLSNIRNNRQSQGPYQQTGRRGLSRPVSLTHPTELGHSRHSSE